MGSNIVSQEADFVWGIDKNAKSIAFAKQCFERVKNGIYYSSEVKFDEFDILHDTRETMKFDVVVAIEIIEHISDYKKFLETIVNKFDAKNPNTPTTYFISTPNRNNAHIGKEKPSNPYHTREWTSEEYWDVLSEYFGEIQFRNSKGIATERSTIHTPLLAECRGAKI